MKVGQVKTVIETTNAEFKADTLKLIHSGKVLKDEQTLTEVGVKEKDFLVVMVSKPKKAAPAPAPAAANAAAEPSPSSAAVPAPSPAAPPAPAAPAALDETVLAGLRDMGFPEAEARAALEAATRVGGGQPLAVEFLMNGIPANFPPAGTPMPASNTAPAPAGSGLAALQQLRQHPQFNQMRQLVQVDIFCLNFC